MQLLEDKQRGRITESDYINALRFLDLKNGKASGEVKKSVPRQRKIKKPPLTKDERQLRGALRSITKWFFDGELFRRCTPLFFGVGDSESLVQVEFNKIAKKVVDHSAHNPLVASQSSRAVLLSHIQALVTNRRRNIRNSRKPPKPGSKPRKALKSIYETKSVFFVVAADGSYVPVPRPALLPTSAVTTKPTVQVSAATTEPTVQSSAATTEPTVQATDATTEPTVQSSAVMTEPTVQASAVTTGSAIIPPLRKVVVDDELQRLKERMEILKQEKELLDEVNKVIDVYDGGCNKREDGIDILVTGGAMNVACFECGKDCLASIAKPRGKPSLTTNH